MKKVLAASLVLLAGLFLAQTTDALSPVNTAPAFLNERKTEIPALDLDFRISFDSRIAFTRATEARCFDQGGILITFASGAERLPCFTYDGTNWINRGYLTEEARTNVALQSEALGTTWTIPGSNTTITDNAGVAVDGATTAEDVLHGDNAETVQQTITVTDNTVVNISAFVKQGSTGSHDFVKIAWLDESGGNNGFEAWFDLSTGNVGTAQADGTGTFNSGSAIMTDVGSGWYRISASGQIVTGQTDGRFELINTTADAVDTAEATNSVFWWGMMVEEEFHTTVRTSYVPTTTGSVARNADVSIMSDVTWSNTQRGTFLTEAFSYDVSSENTDAHLWIILDDADVGNDPSISQQMGSSGARFNTNYTVSTGNPAFTNGASNDLVNATPFKSIVTYAQDDMVTIVNARPSDTDTTLDVDADANAFDTFFIGSNLSSARQWNGHLTRITYWNRRLFPDGRLDDKTTLLEWLGGTMFAANDNEWALMEAVGW